MKRKKKRKIDSELRASTFLMCAWISLFFVSIVNLIKSILDDKMSKPVYLTLAGVGLAVALCFIVCWVWVKISLKNKGDTDSTQQPIQEDKGEQLQVKSQNR